MKVRQLLLSNINIGLHEGMKMLPVQGGELYRKHTYAAPAPGTGNSMVTLTFKQLSALAEEGDESSLVERSAHWRPNTAGASGVKRKRAQSRVGNGQPQLRAEPGGGRRSPPSRPEYSTRRRRRVSATTRGVASVVRGPSVRLHTTRAQEQSRSGSSSRKRCCRRHPHRRRRNSSRRHQPWQQGHRGQERVEQEGRGRTPCASAGTMCPLVGEGGRGNGSNN